MYYSLIKSSYNQDSEYIYYPPTFPHEPLSTLLPTLPSPSPRSPLIYFLSPQFSLHFLEFYINGNIKCLSAFIQFISPRIILLSIIHVITCINSSLLCTKQYSLGWMYHNLFIHSAVNGHLTCLSFGAIKNKATINICK